MEASQDHCAFVLILIISKIGNMTWVVLLLLLVASQARHFETTIKFTLFGRNKGWIYIDKMTFAPGAARVILETSVTGLPYGRNTDLFMQAVPQERWDKESVDRCTNPVRMPLAIHEIKLDGSTTTSQFSFGINDYQTYYFVLKDCQSRLLSEYNNTNLSLNVKLHLLNNNREVGEEEDHWYIVPFIIGAGLLLVYFYMKEYKTMDTIDWPKMMLFAGTVTQISSLCWKSFGFLIYVYTGSDHFFFHLIYLLLHSASESAIVALVILIGFGWTLNYSYGKQFDIFLPVVGCLGIINVIITMITKVGHSHDRHHVFDNVGGTILIVFRLILALVFVGGCIYTYRQVRHNLKQFLVKFAILGFVYVASMPIIVILANYLIEPRNRHEFVFITVEVFKFATNLILAYEINSKTSAYNKVNFKNASFIPEELPGF